VLQGEALRRADAICIWSGRPLFWGPQAKADTPGKAGGAWQGGYLMYFGSNVVRFVEHFEPKGVVLAGLSASGAEPLTKYQIERFKASLLALEPAEQGCRQGTGKGYENCPPARNERPVIFPRPRCRLKPNEGAGSKRRVAESRSSCEAPPNCLICRSKVREHSYAVTEVFRSRNHAKRQPLSVAHCKRYNCQCLRGETGAYRRRNK